MSETDHNFDSQFYNCVSSSGDFAISSYFRKQCKWSVKSALLGTEQDNSAAGAQFHISSAEMCAYKHVHNVKCTYTVWMAKVHAALIANAVAAFSPPYPYILTVNGTSQLAWHNFLKYQTEPIICIRWKWLLIARKASLPNSMNSTSNRTIIRFKAIYICSWNILLRSSCRIFWCVCVVWVIWNEYIRMTS